MWCLLFINRIVAAHFLTGILVLAANTFLPAVFLFEKPLQAVALRPLHDCGLYPRRKIAFGVAQGIYGIQQIGLAAAIPARDARYRKIQRIGSLRIVTELKKGYFAQQYENEI
jgi:hypothetical protein